MIVYNLARGRGNLDRTVQLCRDEALEISERLDRKDPVARVLWFLLTVAAALPDTRLVEISVNEHELEVLLNAVAVPA